MYRIYLFVGCSSGWYVEYSGCDHSGLEIDLPLPTQVCNIVVCSGNDIAKSSDLKLLIAMASVSIIT